MADRPSRIVAGLQHLRNIFQYAACNLAIQERSSESKKMMVSTPSRKLSVAAIIAVSLAFFLFVQGMYSLLLEVRSFDVDQTNIAFDSDQTKISFLSKSGAGAWCLKSGYRSDSPSREHTGKIHCSSCLVPDENGWGSVFGPIQILSDMIPRPGIEAQLNYAHWGAPPAFRLEGWLSAWTSQGPPLA
jgi:hypothetical protein